LNGSPRATLQLMSAQAASDRADEALRSFAQFVAMGQASDEVLKSNSFDPLRALPKYRQIHADMAANGARQTSASAVFALQSSAQVPEDIDFDAPSRLFSSARYSAGRSCKWSCRAA